LDRYGVRQLGSLQCHGVARGGRSAKPLPASSQVFEKLILDRIQAFGRGDARSYAELVDPDFVHISDMGGRRTAKQLEPYIVSGKSSAKFAVRDLSFKIHGQLAVVDCEIVATDALATQRSAGDGCVRSARLSMGLHIACGNQSFRKVP
jgi:hypothetical protein